MTRLPMAELERVLDAAAVTHPQSPTFGDFRAPSTLVVAEAEALAAARHWITPHTGIAALAAERTVTLPWHLPTARAGRRGTKLVFPASTVGRKGAWELRAVLRELQLPLTLGGPVLEGSGFWDGVATTPAAPNWLEDAAAVVLPAWVEHQPRRLLQAVAANVPVIATTACGLAGVPGVTTIPIGDVTALRDALIEVCGRVRS